MVGWSLLVGLIGLAVARFVRSERRVLVMGVTVVLACAAVHAAVAGWPNFPPTQSLDVVPLLLLGGVVLAAARGRSATMLLSLPVAAACVWFIVSRLRGMPIGEQVLLSVGTSLVLVALWWPALAETTRATLIPGVLAVVAGGAAGAAQFSHSSKVSAISGGLAVCLALVASLTLWRPCAHVARGTALAGCVALGVLLVFDQNMLDLPALELGLLGLGWATLHLGRLRFFRAMSEPRAMIVHALLAVPPVVAAVVIGWQRYQVGLESRSYY